MIRDVHQQWLLDCDFRDVCLKDHTVDSNHAHIWVPDYSLGESLFDSDVQGGLIRSVEVDELDTRLGTEEKWNEFVAIMGRQEIKKLILLCNHEEHDNPIVDAYRKCTLKAYVYRFIRAGIECKIMSFHKG